MASGLFPSARAVLAAEGCYQTTRSGFKVAHPAVKAADQAAAFIRRSLADFGLTPQSAKMVKTATAPPDDDPLANLIRTRNRHSQPFSESEDER